MREFKSRLKKLGISYARLAKTLNIPESTLKKWVNAPDGSFNRISLIAEALGTPLEVILKSINEQNLLTFTMNKDQQALFSKNRTAFDVYWLLVYERKTLDEVMSTLKISGADLKSILFKLDRVNLLIVGAMDKVKIPRMIPIRWVFQGPFMESLKKEWIEGIVKSTVNLQFFQLTAASREELYKELNMLEEKFARRTIMELSGDSKKLTQIRYLSASAPGSFVRNET